MAARAPLKGSPGHRLLGGMGRAVPAKLSNLAALRVAASHVVAVTRCCLHTLFHTSRDLSSGEREVNGYFRIYFDRFAVQQVRFVLPLLHGVQCTLHQHGMPADQLQVLDGTILADLCSQ